MSTIKIDVNCILEDFSALPNGNTEDNSLKCNLPVPLNRKIKLMMVPGLSQEVGTFQPLAMQSLLSNRLIFGICMY